MIGAAALIAVAIVIAAVAVAVLVRDPHAGQVKVPIDSRDAGTSTATVGLGDAGSPRADGGAARPRDVVDAGPKKKPHVKKQLPDAGHAPDIYSP